MLQSDRSSAQLEDPDPTQSGYSGIQIEVRKAGIDRRQW